MQIKNDQMITLLKTYFEQRNEPIAAHKAMSIPHTLPGLAAYYSTSTVNHTGAMIDNSGGGQTLTQGGGGGVFGYRTSGGGGGLGLVPTVAYKGSQYHSSSSSAVFNIIGTETVINFPGLSIGCWVRCSTTASNMHIIGKAISTIGSASSSYRLMHASAGPYLRFDVTNGVTARSVPSSVASTTSEWQFVAGVFEPSSAMHIWVGDSGILTQDTATGSIPASANSNATQFTVGASATPGVYFSGEISMVWLCRGILLDAHIQTLYHSTKVLFGH